MTPDSIPPTISVFSHTSIKYSINHWDEYRWGLTETLRSRTNVVISLLIGADMVRRQLIDPKWAAWPVWLHVISAVGVIAIAFVIVGFFQALFIAFHLLLLRKRPGIYGEHWVELRPDGLMERTAAGESLVRWDALRKIVHTRKYLYIFRKDATTLQIPKRYFESTGQIERFCDEIRRRCQAGS